MQNRTRQVLATAVAACALFTASRFAAAAPVSYTGGTYSENFDTLPNSPGQSVTQFLAPGPNDAPNVAGWSFARFASGSANPPATMDFRIDNGSTNAVGHAGSYGATDSTDRAFGSAGTTNTVPNLGFQLINDTGAALDQFTITFTGEQWRRGTQGQSQNPPIPGVLSFQYSTNATNILNGIFNSAPQLNFSSPNTGLPVATALDGNADGNRTFITATVGGFLWNPGQVMTFRWNDFNDPDADDWLAIDDLSLTARLGTQLKWNTDNLTGTWDTNVDNKPWLDSTPAASHFSTGDTVALADTSSDIDITVDGGGVSPVATIVNHAANQYILSGGQISGSLVKSNGGTVVLRSLNAFNSVNISGGTVETQVDGALGAVTINATNGGTWKTSGVAQTSTNTFAITGAGTIHAETDLTQNARITGAAAIFVKEGPGLVWARQNFALTGASEIHVNGGTLRDSDDLANFSDGIPDSVVLRIAAGATFDESYGNGEQFAGLAGDGTYIGHTVSGGSGHINVMNNVATDTFTFNGLITAGTNGVIGATPDERQLLALRKNGAHTWVLTNPLTDVAAHVQINAGVLSIPHISNRGQTSPIGMGNIATTPAIVGGDIRIGASDGSTAGTLRYTGPSSSTDRTIQLNSGGGILDITEATTVLTWEGQISGGSIVPMQKNGPGTLVLTADNIFGADLDVNGGTLLVSNTTGSGTGGGHVRAKNGGTVGGTGTIGSNFTVESGGTLAPGASIGTLSVSGFSSIQGGAKLLWELDSTANTSDLLNVTSAEVAGPATFDFIELGTAAPNTFTLIKYQGSFTGFSNLSVGLTPSPLMSYTLVDNVENFSVDLQVTSGSGPQWNVDSDGSFAEASNWLPATVPNGTSGAAATASFLGKITAARTVTLDGDHTVANVNFDNASSYTIAQGTSGTLTIGGDATLASIVVASGSHAISAPVNLAGATSINVSDSMFLTMSGPLSVAAGKTVTKSGGRGTLTISGAQNHGAGAVLDVGLGLVNLNSNAGTAATGASSAVANLALRITGTVEPADTPVVMLGASQDLQELTIQIGDTGGQILDLNSPAAPGAFHAVRIYGGDLEGAKVALYDAIKSAGEGIIDTGLHAGAGIGIALKPDAFGQQHLMIRSTRVGDLNLDGIVSISDFIDLASNFNTLNTATWQEGDLNNDGGVTISDFIDLASNFNSSYSGESWAISAADEATLAAFAAANGVPEPAALGLAAVGAMGLMMRRRRK